MRLIYIRGRRFFSIFFKDVRRYSVRGSTFLGISKCISEGFYISVFSVKYSLRVMLVFRVKSCFLCFGRWVIVFFY